MVTHEAIVITPHAGSAIVEDATVASQTMAATYMAQCCGLQADFQTINFPTTGGFPLRSDRRFNFAFILAGLGTFSNFFGMVGGQP